MMMKEWHDGIARAIIPLYMLTINARQQRTCMVCALLLHAVCRQCRGASPHASAPARGPMPVQRRPSSRTADNASNESHSLPPAMRSHVRLASLPAPAMLHIS